VAGLQGVRGNALGHAHEDESRGDSGDGANAALPDEVRGQRDRGEAHGGDDEAEAVDEPVGFDPALGDDEGADEVADVVQGRDPCAGSGTPVEGCDHERQCRGVEEPAHAHRHREAERPANGGEGGTGAAFGHGDSSSRVGSGGVISSTTMPWPRVGCLGGRGFGREASRKGLWKLLIPRGQGRVIGVNLRRSIQGGVVALALVLSGCSWFDSDDSSSSSQSPEPSPTPTEFEQSFAGAVSGDDAVVTATADRLGSRLTADNVGVSFEATDLADPRLDPAQSNLDEQLKTLGSPALRFGGNALDRRLFWTSKGEKPKHGEKVTI